MSQGLRCRQRRVWFNDLYSPILPHRQEKFCFVCFPPEYFHLANKVIKKKKKKGWGIVPGRNEKNTKELFLVSLEYFLVSLEYF